MNRIGLCSLAAVSLVTLIAGCSKDPPPAQQPTQPQPYAGQYQPGQPGYQPQPQPGQPGYQPQPQPGYQPQPGPQPGQPNTQPQPQPAPSGGGFQIPGLPGTQPAPSGGGGGTAQQIDPNVAQLAVGPLTIFANTEAPGMAKEGPTVAGNFQTGQTLESQFSFQPGKCYTVVAVGAGPTEVDIEMQYVTPIPGLNPSIGRDSQKGAQASIGGKGNCLKPLSPMATNAKFIVRAVSGAGLIAAQLYSK